MIRRKNAVLLIILSLLFLFGCEQTSNQKTSSGAIVKYEYLSLDKQYSNKVNNWLSEVRENASDLYHLSLADGVEYVYGKGYNQARVSYTYEDFEGKINRTVKATLLKGEKDDEVLIKITHETDVDGVTLEVIDDKAKFYN